MQNPHKKKANKDKKKNKNNKVVELKKGKPKQQRTVKLLSALDQMSIAKDFPGTIDAPFVAGMSIQKDLISVMPDVGLSIPRVYSYQSGAVGPIVDEYLCLVWCPTLTQLISPPGPGLITGRLGGLMAFQTNNTAIGFSVAEFGNSLTAYSDQEVYGTSFDTIGRHGLVWASELSIRILAPAATIVGAAWHGKVSLASLLTDSGTPTPSITIRELIAIKKEIEFQNDVTPSFHMRSSLVNNDLVFSHNHDMNQIGEEYAGEYFEYLIIQRGAASLNNNNITYSLMCEVDANAVVFRRTDDTAAFNLQSKDTVISGPKSYNETHKDEMAPHMVGGMPRDQYKKHISSKIDTGASNAKVHENDLKDIYRMTPHMKAKVYKAWKKDYDDHFKKTGDLRALKDDQPETLVYHVSSVVQQINKMTILQGEFPALIDPDNLLEKFQDLQQKLIDLVQKPIFNQRLITIPNPAYSPPDISMYISPSKAPIEAEAMLKLSLEGLVPQYFISDNQLILNSLDSNDLYWDKCYKYDCKAHVQNNSSPIRVVDPIPDRSTSQDTISRVSKASWQKPRINGRNRLPINTVETDYNVHRFEVSKSYPHMQSYYDSLSEIDQNFIRLCVENYELRYDWYGHAKTRRRHASKYLLDHPSPLSKLFSTWYETQKNLKWISTLVFLVTIPDNGRLKSISYERSDNYHHHCAVHTDRQTIIGTTEIKLPYDARIAFDESDPKVALQHQAAETTRTEVIRRLNVITSRILSSQLQSSLKTTDDQEFVCDIADANLSSRSLQLGYAELFETHTSFLEHEYLNALSGI